MPFFWKDVYHVFYLTNPTGNHDVCWEHCVSEDLTTWRELPTALSPDPKDPNGPEGCSMFTGCVVERDSIFHAWYTSWNPGNPDGREFLSHATSDDLIGWQKHPEHMIAPDGEHYAGHQDRDFRDPQIFWNEEAGEYWMHLLGNVPGEGGWVFGLLTSRNLVDWQQQAPLEGIPGDECPDYFSIGDTHYIHSCGKYCYSSSLEGPYEYPEMANELDRPLLAAGKRVWDGKRHVWFGGWAGGPMPLPREVYGGPNGLLYMKPVEEVVAAFDRTAIDLTDIARSTPGAVFDVPEDYMLDCRVKLTPESQLAISIGGQCHYRLLPERGQLSLVAPGIDRERPCPVDTTKPVKIQVFVEGTLVECFINDQFAQTCKVTQGKENKLRLVSEDDSVEVLKLLVKTRQ